MICTLQTRSAVTAALQTQLRHWRVIIQLESSRGGRIVPQTSGGLRLDQGGTAACSPLHPSVHATHHGGTPLKHGALRHDGFQPPMFFFGFPLGNGMPKYRSGIATPSPWMPTKPLCNAGTAGPPIVVVIAMEDSSHRWHQHGLQPASLHYGHRHHM